MNIELWSKVSDEQSPCGEDLEYDVEFLALGQAVQGKPEQQYGDTVIPAEEPDWREVERLGEALLNRTKDVRVCVLLLRAYTRNYGLVGCAQGLQALLALLEAYWDQAHPLLVIDGDHDPFMRANALAGLADVSGLIKDLRAAVLTKSALGMVLIKDAEAALDSNASELAYSREQLSAIYADNAEQPTMVALHDANNAFKAIAAMSDDRLGSAYAPDLSPMLQLLANVVRSVQSSTTSQDVGDAAAGEEEASADGGAANQPRAASAPGEIRSREDAIRVLETVCKYIERTEPTNPAPLLIKRAQRLMTLSFLDIIKELAPNGMDQAEMITGVRREY
jgi:type VI secretion system protein ImpA